MPDIIMSPPTGAIGASPSNKALANEYRATLKGLLEKERALEDAPDGVQIRYKRAVLKEMIRDARNTIRQLDPRQGKYHGGRRCSMDGGLSERRLNYLAWERSESMTRTNQEELEWMRAVVDDGTAVLTSRQRQVLGMRYREGKRQKVIAEELGVDSSTISRTLLRAEDKLRRYADARTLAADCTGPDGRLDVARLVRETHVLTERQRQVLALALAGLPTWATAKKLGVHPTTATRTRQRAEWKLYRLVGVYRRGSRKAVDWDTTCRDLATAYGIGLGAVYKAVGGIQKGRDGLTLLQREVVRRRHTGMAVDEIAAELEISKDAVYHQLKRAADIPKTLKEKEEAKMCTIIEIAAREDGGHGLQSQSHREGNWEGPNWIEVPPQFEKAVWDCCGYCDLVIEDGKLVDLVPGTPPPRPEPPETLSPEELTQIIQTMSRGVTNA